MLYSFEVRAMSPVCGAAFDFDEADVDGGFRVFGVRLAGDEVEAAIVRFDAFDHAPPAASSCLMATWTAMRLNFRVSDHSRDLRRVRSGCGSTQARPTCWMSPIMHSASRAQFGGALLQPAIEFVEPVLDCLHVGGERWRCRRAACFPGISAMRRFWR